MNINYLKIPTTPSFGEGWQPVLDALRKGRFFASTGEVLIPTFTVNGRESGDTLKVPGGEAIMEAAIEWTFPMAFAEIVSGDGKTVHRHRVELSTTEAFGQTTLRIPVNLAGSTWVRLEVWDAARNGAFTQPVWLER